MFHMTTNLTEHPFIAAGIVLLLAVVWRLWGWLSKRKRHRNKIEPKAPWDGVHKLVGIKYFEWYAGMDDFHTGYIWKCTCGNGNAHRYWRLPHNEELAIAEYKKHRKLHEDMEKSFGS